MKCLKYVLLGSVAAISVLIAGSASALTIDEALKSAYENNPSLNADRANQRATDEKMAQAISGFLPQVTLTYSRFDQKTKITGREEVEKYGDTQSLTLNQPLFNGGSTVARTFSARNQVMAGREGLKSSEQDILLQSITAYNDVIRDKAVLDLNKNNQEVLQKRLDMTRERFKVGELTKTDVAQSESRLASAVASVAQAEASYNSAVSNFIEIVQMKPEGLEAAARLGKSPETLEEAIKIAEENNPAFKAARYQDKAAKQDTIASVGDILPDVTFSASRDVQDDTSAFVNGSIDENKVGVNFRVPLYQSGAEWSRLRQAKRLAERRKHEVAASRNKVTDDVTQSWERLKAAEATIAATKEAVAAAELAVEGTQMEADLGTRTTLEVLDTQQELFQTKVNLVRAERDANVAYYSLISNMGLLTAEGLGLNVKYYDPKKYYNRAKLEIIGW